MPRATPKLPVSERVKEDRLRRIRESQAERKVADSYIKRQSMPLVEGVLKQRAMKARNTVRGRKAVRNLQNLKVELAERAKFNREVNQFANAEGAMDKPKTYTFRPEDPHSKWKPPARWNEPARSTGSIRSVVAAKRWAEGGVFNNPRQVATRKMMRDTMGTPDDVNAIVGDYAGFGDTFKQDKQVRHYRPRK